MLISLLNLNLKSNYSIFEIGTNNFGEIKNLTKIVKPNQKYLLQIFNLHILKILNQKIISQEKNQIFFHEKYNKLREKLYLNTKLIYMKKNIA